MTHRIVPADPFTIRISEAEVTDLKRRLRAAVPRTLSRCCAGPRRSR